jgi:hypothetical protein
MAPTRLISHYWDLTRLPIAPDKAKFVSDFRFLLLNKGIQERFGLEYKARERIRKSSPLPTIPRVGEVRPPGNTRFLDRTFWRVLLKGKREQFLEDLLAKRHLFPMRIYPPWEIELAGDTEDVGTAEMKCYIALSPWCFASNLRISVNLADGSLPTLEQAIKQFVNRGGSLKIKVQRQYTSVSRLFDRIKDLMMKGILCQQPASQSCRPQDLYTSTCLPSGVFLSKSNTDALCWMQEQQLVSSEGECIRGETDEDFVIVDKRRCFIYVSRHPIFHLNNWVGLRFLYESTVITSAAVVSQIYDLGQPSQDAISRVQVGLRMVDYFRQTPWKHAIRAWERYDGHDVNTYQKWREALDTYLKAMRERRQSMSTLNVFGNITTGILNLGQIDRVKSIEANVLALSQSGLEDVADALKSLTTAVATNAELAEEQRQTALDILDELSKQATLPREKQAAIGTLRTIIGGLGSVLSAGGGLAEIWSTWGSSIRAFFGI